MVCPVWCAVPCFTKEKGNSVYYPKESKASCINRRVGCSTNQVNQCISISKTKERRQLVYPNPSHVFHKSVSLPSFHKLVAQNRQIPLDQIPRLALLRTLSPAQKRYIEVQHRVAMAAQPRLVLFTALLGAHDGGVHVNQAARVAVLGAAPAREDGHVEAQQPAGEAAAGGCP